LTGSTYLTFLSIPADKFTFTAGERKTLAFLHEAGIPITVSSCSVCGTGLCKTAGEDSAVIVFAGTVDDGGKAISQPPQVELWTKHRLEWCGAVGKGEIAGFKEFPP